MSDYIVTGRTGENHVTAADAGALNACFAGEGRYVAAGVGEALAAEVISNNCVRIKSGEAINQGRHMRVSANTYVDCTIQNGSQNTKRYDLIVFRYTRNVETDIEKAEIVVIHGTSASTASDPTYTAGNILAGARQDDMLLYRVRINGINIEAVDKLFTELPSLAALNEKRVDLTGRVSNVEKAVSQLNSDVAPYVFTKDANIQSFLRGMKVGSKIRYISGYCILPFGWNPSYTIVKLYEYADSDSQGCLVGENKIYPISLKKGHDVIHCDDDLVPAGKYYLSIMFTI